MRKDSAKMVLLAAWTLIAVSGFAREAAAGQTPSTPGTPAPNTPAPGAPNDPNGSNLPQVGTTPASPSGTTAPAGTNQSLPAAASGNAAAANASPDFDIDRTLLSALASSTEFANARRFVSGDTAAVGVAEARGRTNVSASATATEFDEATKINFGGNTIYALRDHREQLTLGATQPIDLTGQIHAASSQAKLQALADQFTVDRIAQARVLQAKTDFYNYLRSQHQVQVAQASLRAAQNQRDIAKHLYEGGVGQKIDYLRAETNVASAEQDLTRAQNDSDISRATFNDLVGRPLDAPVNAHDVVGATVGVDAVPANAVGTPDATFTPFTPPAAEIDSINANASIATAQSRRPEVLQNQVLVRVAETGVKLARAGLEPGLSISAAGNYYPTTSFADFRHATGALTASLTLPLYDGGATRDQIREARTRVDTAKASLESSKTDVALAVREAYLNLVTAARQITSANATLEQAVAARQLAQVRYEGQVGLFLEVTDAQAALVRAENAQVDAVYDYFVARARFDNATGTPVQY